MRVAADHFVGDGLDHIVHGEQTFFLCNPGVHDHLHEQIAEFFLQIIRIAGRSRILIPQMTSAASSMQGAFQGGMGLGAVPWAAVGGAKTCDHLFKFLKFRHENASLPM